MTEANSNEDDALPVPTKADRARLGNLLRAFSDAPSLLNISPQNRIDVWVIEQRMKADRRANDRLAKATWGLVLATFGLLSATIGHVVGSSHDREILASGVGPTGVYQALPEGGTAVIAEPAKTFSRMFRGYDPAAVDAYIEVLISKQELLLDDVERLRWSPKIPLLAHRALST